MGADIERCELPKGSRSRRNSGVQRREDMGSFSIALSGLQADTVSLNTIGNNLANLNTTAYKNQGTTFEDLFYQQIGTSGSNNPLQVGVGTRVSGTATNFTQGTLLP